LTLIRIPNMKTRGQKSTSFFSGQSCNIFFWWSTSR